jgi:molybdopterin synthase sulfur carrier subunit
MASPMTVTIYVPAQLRPYCDGAREISLAAPTVLAALKSIEQRFPYLYQGVCDETGRVRRHVNLFVNTDHVRDLQGLDTPLAAGDTLVILPAVSGG